MQDPELYVRQFQEEMSYRIKRKQPWLYPDDNRLHERPRVRKIEPPSQIYSQQLLRSQNYAPDQLINFTKPLINYAITSPSQKDTPQGRYNHNYVYLGQQQDNIFRKEPFNQSQQDYNIQQQRYSQQQHEQRVNYQNVGNMLISNNTGEAAYQQQQQQLQQSQLQNGYGKVQDTQSQPQQPQQQFVSQYQQPISQQQIHSQPNQQTQSTQPTQYHQQQYYPYQAGSPNSYKVKGDSNVTKNDYKFYGSRALKNLDSTQIY